MRAPVLLRLCRACGRDMVGAECSFCDVATPEPEQPSPSERVFRCVERHSGLVVGDICELLGIFDDTGIDATSKMLSRLVRRGALRCEGGRADRTYFAVDADMLPRKVKVKEPTQRKRRKDRGRVASPKELRKWAETYATLKAEGKCPRCRAFKLPEWRGIYCPTCSEAEKVRHQEYRKRHPDREATRQREKAIRVAAESRATGKCRWCNEQAIPGRLRCLACNRLAAEQDRERRQAWRDAGLCGCGQPTEPGRRGCVKCRAKWLAKAEELRQQRQARSA